MTWLWMNPPTELTLGLVFHLGNRVIHKVTLCFSPYPLFQWSPQSKEIFIKSGYEMLKLGILMHKVRE
jgi:hypothetical protein